MLWIIVLLMCCLPTVESEVGKKAKIIVGRLGNELLLNFQLSDLRDEYNKYITENGEKITERQIQIPDLKMNSEIRFRNVKYPRILFINGSASSPTEITLTNDAFVVKKTKLQKEDAGIYWVDYYSIMLGQKVLIIAGKATIIERSPPNPVLKPEDNYTSIIQLECHSVTTSIGEYPLPMYTVWYKNGMRMTDVDPTLSQINVTVDHNGGNFICLATDYLPCYQRLQTTKQYVLNIEECNNVSESETFIVQPEFAPIDVKLEPDQRKIFVNENDDLKVRCSAKCRPMCNVTWGKDFQDFKSISLIYLTENIIENDLVIENVNSSHEGVYVCLVNNIHGETKKGFTLTVGEVRNKAVNNVIKDVLDSVIVVAVVTLIVVILLLITRNIILYKKKKNEPHHTSSEEGDGIYEVVDQLIPEDDIYESMELPRISGEHNSRNGEPRTSTDNNSRNSEPGTSIDNNSRNGEPGTSTDNNYRNGEPGTSNDNNSRNGEPGTSRDYNSRNGEPGISTDTNSRNGEPGTSTDNNSTNSEPGTSTDNNSRNGEPGISRDINSTNGEQNVNPENGEYDSLEFTILDGPAPERIYTRLSQNHRRYPQLFNRILRKNGRKGFDS